MHLCKLLEAASIIYMQSVFLEIIDVAIDSSSLLCTLMCGCIILINYQNVCKTLKTPTF